MSVILLVLLSSIIVSILFMLLPVATYRIQGGIAVLLSALMIVGSWQVYYFAPTYFQVTFPTHFPSFLHSLSGVLLFSTNWVSSVLLVFASVIAFLVALSYYFQGAGKPTEQSFSAWYLLATGLGFLMLLADHLYMIVFLWGISGIPLYMLISSQEETGAAAAKMTLIVFGSAHGIMITGAVMAVSLNGGGFLSSMGIDTGSWAGSVAFFSMLAGGLMKAGIFPFHSWTSSYMRATSGSPSAWLVILTEKTVGIYFIIRMTQDLFILSDRVRLVLMVVAAVTVFLSLLLSLSERNIPARIGHLAGMISGMMLLGAATGIVMGAAATIAYLMVSVPAVIALLILHGNDRNSESGQPGTKVLSPGGSMVKRLSSILLYSLAGIPPLGVFVANFVLISAFLLSWDGLPVLPGLQLLGAGITITGSAALVTGLLMFKKTLPDLSKTKGAGNGRENFKWMIIFLVSAFALVTAFGGWLALVRIDQNLAIRLFRDAAYLSKQIQLLITAILVAGSLLLGWLLIRFIEARGKGSLQTIGKIQEKGWLDVYHVFSQMVFAINRPLSRLHDGVLQTYLVWVLAALALLFLLK